MSSATLARDEMDDPAPQGAESPPMGRAGQSPSPMPSPDAPRTSKNPAREEPDRGQDSLVTVPAGSRGRRIALAVIVLSALTFVAAVPFVRVPLPQVPAFVASYEAALAINDLITFLLLFGLFHRVRSSAALALAAGYLFDALIMVPHALTFPGLFSPTGLLGAGSQSTAWLYMFWHGGFPIFVISYALFQDRADRGKARLGSRVGNLGGVLSILAVLGVVATMTLLATAHRDLLPAMIQDNEFTAAMKFVVSIVWMLSLAALFVLWRKRAHSVLDVWLMVVMSAWLFDIAMSAVLDNARFDLGWYAGRTYGLLASSFVLGVLLVETNGLHNRLATTRNELERRKTEEARSLVNRIFATSMDLIMVVDRRGNFIQVSPSSLTLLGYAPEDMVGRSAAEFIYPEDLESTRKETRAARRGRAMRNFDCRYVHKNGRAVTLAWMGIWSEPEQQHFFIGRDMTERLAAEEKLHRAQKMEAIGQLTGGMAHDFNNLLGVVLGNLDLLEERLGPNGETRELLHEALEASLKGADLTRRLLAFARRQPLQPERIEVNSLVENMIKLLSRTLGEQIEISLDTAADLWPVVADPAQLEASLTNLATNARDAMPKGGRLMIATANRHLDADYAAAHVEVTPGDYAMIEVSDNGTGMTKEVMSRIFEPFYTTKERSKGTGLGLSMVFGFMKQSGGHINVYSEPGAGTTFRLYVPRAKEDIQAERRSAAVEVVSGNGETVLAVEDNAGMRRIVLRQLRELGYRVLEAETADAALLILERERVDLLFTDIVMPGEIDGYELARVARSRWPDLKVVLTSGFPEAKVNGNSGPALVTKRLLTKPYRQVDLARTLREALDS